MTAYADGPGQISQALFLSWWSILGEQFRNVNLEEFLNMKEDFYFKKNVHWAMKISCLSWQQKVEEVIESGACFDWAQQAGVSQASA